MSISCCDPKSLPRTDALKGKQIDPPNRVRLLAGAWVTVEIQFPSVIKTLTDPGAAIIAHPFKDNGTDVTAVYTSNETTGVRSLYLHAPGQWRIQNTGVADVEAIKLDTFNDAAAAFYGGIRVTGIASPVTFTGTLTPGTFTPTHVTPIDIDSGADEEVLAAGSYGHLYFRNVSTGTQIITLTGGGVVAVSGTGWTLNPDPTGAKAGEVIAWNNPDQMPAGPFRAIASADNALLLIVHGS